MLSAGCQVSATELSAAGAKCEALGPATRDVFLPGIFSHHIETQGLSWFFDSSRLPQNPDSSPTKLSS